MEKMFGQIQTNSMSLFSFGVASVRFSIGLYFEIFSHFKNSEINQKELKVSHPISLEQRNELLLLGLHQAKAKS